jgi:hypothetical protein
MSRRRRKANVSIYERPFLQRPAFFQRQALFWSMRPDLASKACMDVQDCEIGKQWLGVFASCYS